MSGSNIKLIENFIDYCSAKNKVLSRNIANIGTENYQREDVYFKDALNAQMPSLRMTETKHFKSITDDSSDQPFEFKIDKSAEKLSGANNVDIDTEMAELADNTIKFKFAARKLNMYFRNLQEVIKGGGL